MEAIGFVGPAVLVVFFLIGLIVYACCCSERTDDDNYAPPTNLDATVIPQVPSDPTVQRDMANRIGRLRNSMRRSLKKIARTRRAPGSFQPLEEASDARHIQHALRGRATQPTIAAASVPLSASCLPSRGGNVNAAFQPAGGHFCLNEMQQASRPPSYTTVDYQASSALPPPPYAHVFASNDASETII